MIEVVTLLNTQSKVFGKTGTAIDGQPVRVNQSLRVFWEKLGQLGLDYVYPIEKVNLFSKRRGGAPIEKAPGHPRASEVASKAFSTPSQSSFLKINRPVPA